MHQHLPPVYGHLEEAGPDESLLGTLELIGKYRQTAVQDCGSRVSNQEQWEKPEFDR